MRLTVATWNLNDTSRAEESVEYLQDEHGVDLFLLQEMPRRLEGTLPGAVGAFEAPLFSINRSEDVAKKVVQPLLKIYRQ